MASVTMQNIRAVDWDKSNFWNIYFDKNPEGFTDKFIPVNDVDILLAGVNTSEFADTGLKYISDRTKPEISISFYDNEKLSFVNYITEWIEEIAPIDDTYVAPINSAKRKLFIEKLDREHNVVKTWVAFVIPSSEIHYHGDSDGNVPIYTINFAVVGGNF